MCQRNLSLKQEFTQLKELNIVNYMFYTNLHNHEWRKIILSYIHKGMFWVGDVPVMIDNDMIHRLTGSSNEGRNPINEKNVKKMVETNLKTKIRWKPI